VLAAATTLTAGWLWVTSRRLWRRVTVDAESLQ
jgi:hypothetical protein